MREIVLDTETTGLDPKDGHRIVEIGCIELVNYVPTGATYHCYIDPKRSMPSEAEEVHGLTEEFLSGKPTFDQVVDDFLTFVDIAPLVIHNARFDIGFLNAELARLDRPAMSMDRSIDTVDLARRKFPGAPASLDALCRRFDIDNSARTKHGALLDAELLAEVYLELIGGRQPGFELSASRVMASDTAEVEARPVREPRPHAPSTEEAAAHGAFLEKLTDPIWNR